MSINQDKQLFLQALIDMAIQLERTPLRHEFLKAVKGSKNKLEKYFGNFAVMCQAAGLEQTSHQQAAKLNNDIFRADIEQVMENHKPRLTVDPVEYKRTLIIGDCHFPFVHKPTLERIYEYARLHKPEIIIQVGDLYDLYAHSKFPRSQNLYSPVEEERLGRAGAELMWKTLQEIVPGAKCYQMYGNHDVRPVKRTMEVAPQMEHIIAKYIESLMSFDGVELIADPRKELIIEDIQFIHGYRNKLGDHRDYTMMNTVCGHLHRAGVVYRRVHGKALWEMNVGFIGDPESKVFGYTPQKIKDYTLGFGWIDADGPRFISC